MSEWLILLLIVPAVVVPVVLLVGFAGCNQVFGLDPTTQASLLAHRVSDKRSDNKYTFRVQAADILMPRSQPPRKHTAS
jgi:hypothetical protein